MTPKRRATDREPQSNEPVVFDTCRNIRKECRSNNRYVLGGLVAAFITLTSILYWMNTATAGKVAETREELSAQKSTISSIDERTKEMQHDIKQLLRHR